MRNILKNPETLVAYVDHCQATGDLDPLRELGLLEPLQEPPQAAQEPPKAPPTPPVVEAPKPEPPKATPAT